MDRELAQIWRSDPLGKLAQHQLRACAKWIAVQP